MSCTRTCDGAGESVRHEVRHSCHALIHDGQHVECDWQNEDQAGRHHSKFSQRPSAAGKRPRDGLQVRDGPCRKEEVQQQAEQKYTLECSLSRVQAALRF